MSNNLFYLNKDNEVKVSPHTLKIKAFKNIWERDKSSDKKLAIEELLYVYFMTDYMSEYKQYGVGQEEQIISDIITKEEWFPDELIEKAIKRYGQLQQTTSMKHLQFAKRALENLNDYYSDQMYDKEYVDNLKVNIVTFTSIVNTNKDKLEYLKTQLQDIDKEDPVAISSVEAQIEEKEAFIVKTLELIKDFQKDLFNYKKQYDGSKISKSMKETDDLLNVLTKWEKKVKGEEVEESKIKGGGTMGTFEDEEMASHF